MEKEKKTKNNKKTVVKKSSSQKTNSKQGIKEKQTKLVETQKRNKIKYRTDEQKEMMHFLAVILVVLLCCGLIYLCTRAFITKDLFKKEEAKEEDLIEGQINYDVAVIGTMLNGPYDEYYVIIYDAENGDYISKMSSLVSQYKKEKNAKHVYIVNLSNKLNDGHYDPEHASTSPTSIPELKVGDITLIKVRKGAMNKIITDYEQMQKELGITNK